MGSYPDISLLNSGCFKILVKDKYLIQNVSGEREKRRLLNAYYIIYYFPQYSPCESVEEFATKTTSRCCTSALCAAT